MATPDHAREPCPDRILDDIGGAFSMGAIGGSVYHFIRGVYNSPRGERLLGGAQGVRMNAPRVGGSFAVWGGLFSTFDCTMVYLRQKEDPWNSIAAGAATGGFLQLRAGMKSATRSAIFGGVLLALIEGAGLMLNRMMTPPPPPMEEPIPQTGPPSSGIFPFPAPNTAGMGGQFPSSPGGGSGGGGGASDGSSSSSGSSSWYSGWFGGTKEEPKPYNEKLDSFEANPPPPMPGFEVK
ncbi:hypothetical protein SELMODRAFT_89766 [Selaginella moellendorffii]|uniref:Mitochondrial import inner membrane translocase subunit TIM17-2-like n=1 Tax=Selaginella moellendorffii TaxID=88036 RepID=D8RBA9_SELML|nr:mitochondrial import inner membrane translocase subunit TIM17-2 [Selaginella moellendorffii]EFJ30463.1 hypothetical protein SELMODRAFT_89766 [Selaginella moellendorffii]|eukprot:XP_002968209.1 mitochondrial import inner membrane translocase subunit TIM17-2 [Selaginella moellendorffii]